MLKFIIFIIIFNCFIIHLKSQLYEAILDQFTVNGFNEKCVKEFNGRVTRYNRTVAVINANCTTLLPLDHTNKIRVALSALQGNEFRQIFVVSREDLIKAIEEDSFIYDAMMKKSNLPPKENLQFPPGFYWLKNYVVDAQPPPIMYGHENWKLDMNLFNNDETIFLNLTVTIKVVKRFGIPFV